MWISGQTRPDISNAVLAVAWFSHDPKEIPGTRESGWESPGILERYGPLGPDVWEGKLEDM